MHKSTSSLAVVTFRGGVRDRVLHAVFIAALLLTLSMPLFSSFSMRDVTGVAMTYSLSLISGIGVLLTVLVGGTLIARDIQSRTIFSVATLPLSRSRYLLEKYVGFALLLGCAVALLGCINAAGLLLVAAGEPPERPIRWGAYLLFLLLDYEKLLLLTSILVLFSSVATSTLLPTLMTLAVYAVGCSTEKVKFFVESVIGADKVAPSLRIFSQVIYYLFPNFSLFDLKSQTIYALPLDGKTLVLTSCYGIGYAAVMLCLAGFAFRRRDFL